MKEPEENEHLWVYLALNGMVFAVTSSNPDRIPQAKLPMAIPLSFWRIFAVAFLVFDLQKARRIIFREVNLQKVGQFSWFDTHNSSDIV